MPPDSHPKFAPAWAGSIVLAVVAAACERAPVARDGSASSSESSARVTQGVEGKSESVAPPPAHAVDGVPSDGIIPPERRVVWQPGIPGGIPKRTNVCATLDAKRLGDGKADATKAIQTAIDACAVDHVVMLPAGTYRTTDSLVINKGIVLRGEGPKRTKIVLDRDPKTSTRVIRMGEWGPLPEEKTGVDVVGSFPKGVSTVRVADASKFKVHDIVVIDELDDPDITTKHNCGDCKRAGSAGHRSVGQTDEITAIAGNDLTLASPLYYKLASNLHPMVFPQTNTYIGTVRHAGIEDLYVGHGGGENILVSYVAYSWISNVESDNVLGHHISLSTAYRSVIRDSYVHHAGTYAPGGGSYGITVQAMGSDNLVENNIAYYLNLPIALIASGGGNVIAYNYADGSITGNLPEWQSGDLTSHCAFPHMELIEGNWLQAVNADNVWDGAGYLTYFRNRISGLHENLKDPSGKPVKITGGIVSLNLEANNLYMNVIGNVLWRPNAPGTYEGCENNLVYRLGGWAGPKDDPKNGSCTIDDRVAKTIFRHGNFDYVNNKVLWDDKTPNHTLPASYYLSDKPAFFGDRPWPFVDPVRTEKVGRLPAKDRFDAMH